MNRSSFLNLLSFSFLQVRVSDAGDGVGVLHPHLGFVTSHIVIDRHRGDEG